MNDWKTYKLNEVVEIKYGKDHKHLADGDIPLYGSGGIMRYVDTPLYEQESILIPRKGTLSNLFYLNIPFWSVDTMFYTKIKEGNNGKYLYYLLKSMDLASMNVGSAVPSLTTEVLNKVEINVPDEATQIEIAQILTSLDDKIELNLKMNQTLEAMAQAIFKEWFVNFNFPGFDGELVDGLPKRWRECSMKDFGKIICGKTPSKAVDEYFGGEYMFIKIPDMHNSVFIIETTDSLTELGLNSQSNKTIPPYSICISSIATVGLVCINPKPCQTNQQINTIVPKNGFLKYYIYFLAISMKETFLATASGGTATLNMNTSQFSNLNAILPSDNILKEFDEIVSPLMDKILENNYCNQTLTQTRDTLLPKLMSGKIEIKN
jgi:type I restriction enzyme S subunit